MTDAFRPLRPYAWDLDGGHLYEVPVTTMPFLRIPFHLSYVIYLATFSESIARMYWRLALTACRVSGVEPAVLLHPLDFLGSDDMRLLHFFPGMTMPSAKKLRLVRDCLSELSKRFQVMPIGEYVSHLDGTGAVRRIPPRFTH
jgi:peptidoglycan-N-acetylglucosamine deacetylase